MKTIVADLTKPEATYDAVAKVFNPSGASSEWTDVTQAAGQNKVPQLDILVNNAGVSQRDDFENMGFCLWGCTFSDRTTRWIILLFTVQA